MFRRHIVPILLLAAGVAIIYAQTASFDYVRLDDPDYTFDCAFVKNGLSWANLREAFANLRHGGIWMPVTYLTYMADISLFGPGAGPHHVVSVVFHALNAVLLYCLLLGLLQCTMHNAQCTMRNVECGMRNGVASTPCEPLAACGMDNDDTKRPHLLSVIRYPLSVICSAFVAAAFWAWHPMRVESVAWVASRKDVVFTFFTLLGLLAWLRAARLSMHNAQCTMHNGGAKRQYLLSTIYYLLSIICAALACLSKPTAMVFAFPALAVELVARRGFRPRHLLKYAPLLLMGIATGLVAMYSEHFPEGVDQVLENNGSLAWRCLNALVASGLYLWNTVLPSGLHIVRWPRVGAVPDFCTLGLAALLAAAAGWTLLLLRARRRGDGEAARWLVSSAIWAVVSIGPCLGVFASFGHHAWADRFSYLPAMAVSLLLAFGLLKTLDSLAKRKYLLSTIYYLLSIICVATLAAYAQYARRVTATFRDDFTVWSRAVECDPGHPMGLAHMGSELCNRLGDPDRGIECYRRSLASEPDERTLGQLAFALAMRNGLGDHAEVRRLCAALEKEPGRETQKEALGLQAIGIVAFFDRRWGDAIRFNEAALSHKPENPEDLAMRLAISYYNAGRMKEAERTFRSLALSASSPDARAYAAQCLQMIFRRKYEQSLQ